MKLTDAFPGIGRVIAYSPDVAQMLGYDICTAIFLCQLIYWHGKQRDPEGWIRKKQQEMMAETGLTRSQQERARRILREAGILEETKKKASPPVIGFRLNFVALAAAWKYRLRPYSSDDGTEAKAMEKRESTGSKPTLKSLLEPNQPAVFLENDWDEDSDSDEDYNHHEERLNRPSFGQDILSRFATLPQIHIQR